MRHSLTALAIVAAMAGMASLGEGGISARELRDLPEPQSPTRRAEKLAAAQAKRDRKAARRLVKGTV